MTSRIRTPAHELAVKVWGTGEFDDDVDAQFPARPKPAPRARTIALARSVRAVKIRRPPDSAEPRDLGGRLARTSRALPVRTPDQRYPP